MGCSFYVVRICLQVKNNPYILHKEAALKKKVK